MMKRWSVAVVAAGTPTLYNGHPSTILMPDGSATAKWWTVPAKWWTVPVASREVSEALLAGGSADGRRNPPREAARAVLLQAPRGGLNPAANFGYCRKAVKNDIMLVFSSWGNYALKRKARYKMATSSITANFYTDDPKAANNIVRALFTNVKPSPLPRQKVEIVEFKTAAERRAFLLKVARRARECQPA